MAEIARASRIKGDQGKEKIQPLYRRLLGITGRVMGQAKRFSTAEIASGLKRSSDVRKQAALEGIRQQIDAMAETVKKVVHQAKARGFPAATRTWRARS